MFEDSTFESTGSIRTRSRGWMVAAFLLNGSILLALVLVPLIYPEALPSQRWAFLLTTPPPPPPAPNPPPVQQAAHPFRGAPQMMGATLIVPTMIPRPILIPREPEQPSGPAGIGWNTGSGPGDDINRTFSGHRGGPVVHPSVTGPVRLPSTLVSGNLIHKVTPIYPPIAIATRTAGTVILEATISKAGTIENLHVVSGPPMLQQAALDAVKHWVYRPYLLNGQPVEVDTTVNVVFSLTQ